MNKTYPPSELKRDLCLSAAAPSHSPLTSDNADVDGNARRLNEYKAGRSPTNILHERRRTFQPGLSWLGDDEFESAGLASKLARHHTRPTVARDLPIHIDSKRNRDDLEKLSRPHRRNGPKKRVQVETLRNAENSASQPKRPKRDTVRAPRQKQADPPKPKAVKLDAPKPSQQTPKRPPTPKAPVHLESTNFATLFAAPAFLSDAPSSTVTKTTTTDAASRRIQFALELHGGDYSKLVPNSLVTSQGDPLVYAASTMARRRDLGPNGRLNALEIVRGMVGRSSGSQPTV